MKANRHTMLLGALLGAAIAILPANLAQAKQAECGSASWYALTSKTASGERMDPSKMTAAHRRLPFGSKIEVTNKRNGRKIVVRVNDRGPFVRGRILDLSKAAAGKLGFINSGHTQICLNIVS